MNNRDRHDTYKFPKHIQEYIKESISSHSYKSMADDVNIIFHTNYTETQIRNYCKRHKLCQGFSRFTRSRKPRPIGYEIVNKRDGLIRVKVGYPTGWAFKHKLVWEAEHGPIPENHIIIFLDGNAQNCDISNLRAVTREECAIMTAKKLRFKTPELTETGLLITKINVKQRELAKKEDNNATKVQGD